MANGCKANSFSKLSNATESLFLLLRTSQLLLNTVEKGVLYISHILSKNNIEVGDLDDTMSRSVSWASKSSSVGNRSQHLSVENMMKVSRGAIIISKWFRCHLVLVLMGEYKVREVFERVEHCTDPFKYRQSDVSCKFVYPYLEWDLRCI